MDLWKGFSVWFWNPDIWLPKGYDWEDLIPNEKVSYANWMDLWTYPIFMAFLALILRFLILNKYIYGPIAKYVGIRDIRHRPVEPNSVLEALFKQYKNKPPEAVIVEASVALNKPERYIERWIRKRHAVFRVNKYTKFMECSWQFCYYTLIFCYGLYVMYDKPWLWDINYCWYDYPHHSVDSDVWWYYMLSVSFYWSMTFSHFFETRRKDFWQMFFHHLTTILLITFSWTCNLTRIGTLVFIVHDCADIPLQAAKIFIYLEKKALSDALFTLFTVVWIITRVGIYPLWIVRSTLFEATTIIPIFPAYYIFNTLLVTLIFLHVFWTYLILRIVATTIKKGQLEDARSSSDLSEFSENGGDVSKKKS